MYAELYVDDVLTLYAQWSRFSTGAAFDVTGTSTYRVYEESTTTPILTGNFAALDASNTDGLYSAQITLSAANGFELEKSYCVVAVATVDSVAMQQIVARFTVRVNPKKMIRYFTNSNAIDSATGAGTVADEAGAAAYTYTVTSAGSVRTKGAIS